MKRIGWLLLTIAIGLAGIGCADESDGGPDATATGAATTAPTTAPADSGAQATGGVLDEPKR